jgi:hypothetical protein
MDNAWRDVNPIVVPQAYPAASINDHGLRLLADDDPIGEGGNRRRTGRLRSGDHPWHRRRNNGRPGHNSRRRNRGWLGNNRRRRRLGDMAYRGLCCGHQGFAPAQTIQGEAAQVVPFALENQLRLGAFETPEFTHLLAAPVDDAEAVQIPLRGRQIETQLDVQVLLWTGRENRGRWACFGLIELGDGGNPPRAGRRFGRRVPRYGGQEETAAGHDRNETETFFHGSTPSVRVLGAGHEPASGVGSSPFR